MQSDKIVQTFHANTLSSSSGSRTKPCNKQDASSNQSAPETYSLNLKMKSVHSSETSVIFLSGSSPEESTHTAHCAECALSVHMVFSKAPFERQFSVVTHGLLRNAWLPPQYGVNHRQQFAS
jgi:hypothetical protein